MPLFKDIVGELQKDTITTIYGPPGIGKSTICFQAAINCIRNGKKVIYIDTEYAINSEILTNMGIPEDKFLLIQENGIAELKKILMNIVTDTEPVDRLNTFFCIDSWGMLVNSKLVEDARHEAVRENLNAIDSNIMSNSFISGFASGEL